MNDVNTASQYFNENWKKYQEALKSNTLYHKEMFDILNSFLIDKIGLKPFSFVDIGCGDCSAIIPILTGKSVNKYIGIDAASWVLELAEKNFNSVNCSKKFICMDMVSAISNLESPLDVIFTSYAVHHLSYQEKVEFIKLCHKSLINDGFLIMIDGVLKANQSRNQWLDELENRINNTQGTTLEELIDRMQHPRADDFPEEIATFKNIADNQGWKKFEILFESDISAFMVFTK